MSEVTGGIRKSSWFFSNKFVELFNANFAGDYASNGLQGKPTSTIENPYVTNTNPYYNLFSLFAEQYQSLTPRWLAFVAFDQKFHKMFLTSSMQQRIFAN
jgi:hypothetical protein